MDRFDYRYEQDPAEREPLDNSQAPGHPQWQQHQPQHQQHQQQQYYDPPPSSSDQRPHRRGEHDATAYNNNPTSSPPRAARGAFRPGAHPDSAFSRLRAERRLSREQQFAGGQAPYIATAGAAGAAGAVAASSASHNQGEHVSPISPPLPPAHRGDHDRSFGHDTGYSQPPVAMETHPPTSNITPGSDNFSDSAAGGMAGIAYQVAERNARESGLAAIRGADPVQPGSNRQSYVGDQWNQQQQQIPDQPYDQSYSQPPPTHQQYPQHPPQQQGLRPRAYGAPDADRNSHSSLAGISAAAVAPGNGSPGARTPSRSPHSLPSDVYTDDPYQGYSRANQPALGVVNPNEIDDDDDDGLVYGQRRHRVSMLSLGGGSNRSGHNGAAPMAGGAAAGAAGAGLASSRAAANARSAGYGPVQGGGRAYQEAHDLGIGEKTSRWSGVGPGEGGGGSRRLSKKWRWVIIIAVGVVIVAAIVIGILFGVVFKGSGNNSGSSAAAASGSGAAGGGSSGQSAADDQNEVGDLNADSAQIKAIMNNPNLHKVFPGIDYTPLNSQYPECLQAPPSQNNITRDVAMLIQMTNTIRLYGTDCNQTQMVVHAIRQLRVQDTVKVWLGVWQDGNTTTNERQLHQMWDILDEYGETPFKGLIVANEILFRQQMTAWSLGQLLNEVRANLTRKSMTLPVATSDLGDAWTAELAANSDYIMANIHPFFAGENAKTAANWTHQFWQNKAGSFFKADKSKNVIAEIGWPSQGGNHCGGGTTTTSVCPTKAVAGINELNQLMADFVCAALDDGTNYFWFEAFDEPWKVKFNVDLQQWEDHWGLMDVNRRLKTGVKIPDCGGRTI